jgi:hypothetical protein
MHPGAVTAADIVAFVDGEAAAEIAEHIRGCAECAADAREQGQLQRTLRRALYRIDCPSPQAIGDYQLGMAQPERRVEIARHLLACSLCTAELESLRSFLAEPTVPTLSLVDQLRRTIATLQTTPPGWAVAGVRGVEPGRTRTYEAGDVAISVNGSGHSTAGLCSLMGLVLRGGDLDATSGAEVRLLAADGSVRQAIIDDLGNFVFDALPNGTYGLEVELSDQVVVVKEVPVGHA